MAVMLAINVVLNEKHTCFQWLLTHGPTFKVITAAAAYNPTQIRWRINTAGCRRDR